MQKEVQFQVWVNSLYCRVIGFWYPEDGSPPHTLVVSSVYRPRQEVSGPTPIAPGQSKIPADFIQQQIRHATYMFANNFGVIEFPSKQVVESYITHQTLNYQLKKEYVVVVETTNGTTTLYDLRNSLNAFTDEELKEIEIPIRLENPKDVTIKDYDKYTYLEKEGTDLQYLTITKVRPILEVDPYINNSQLDEDPTVRFTEEELEANPQLMIDAETVLEEDTLNREILKLYDETITENPESVPTREELLQQMLDKEQK